MSPGDGVLAQPAGVVAAAQPVHPVLGRAVQGDRRADDRRGRPGADHRRRAMRWCACSHQLPIWTLRRFDAGQVAVARPAPPAVRPGLADHAHLRRRSARRRLLPRAGGRAVRPARPGDCTVCGAGRPVHRLLDRPRRRRAGRHLRIRRPRRQDRHPLRPAGGPQSSRPDRRPRACGIRRRPLSLDDFSGKVVVLNVWGRGAGRAAPRSPSCSGSRADPSDRGVAVLGIDVRDNPRRRGRFRRRPPITFPSIFDPAMRTMIAFGGKYPTTVIPSTIGARPRAPGCRGVPARTARRGPATPRASGWRPSPHRDNRDDRTRRTRGVRSAAAGASGCACWPALVSLRLAVRGAAGARLPVLPGGGGRREDASRGATRPGRAGVVAGAALFVAGFTVVFVPWAVGRAGLGRPRWCRTSLCCSGSAAC